MKKDTTKIIRDIFAMAFIAAILLTDVNNWWVLIGIVVLSSE